jgi:UDP-galactopyranose mutase
MVFPNGCTIFMTHAPATFGAPFNLIEGQSIMGKKKSGKSAKELKEKKRKKAKLKKAQKAKQAKKAKKCKRCGKKVK